MKNTFTLSARGWIAVVLASVSPSYLCYAPLLDSSNHVQGDFGRVTVAITDQWFLNFQIGRRRNGVISSIHGFKVTPEY